MTTISDKQKAKFQVGAHCSIAGGHDKAIYLGQNLGCEVIQVFTKNNMQWFAKPLLQKSIDDYKKAKNETGLKNVFAHAGYLINLATTKPENLEKSRQSLLDELNRSSQLEFPFIVLHPGAHLGKGEEAGLNLIIESLDIVFKKYEGETKIALEITAGSGTVMGNKIEHLAYLIKNSPHGDRLVVCLDTCHLFAAGYDVRTKIGINNFIKEFEKNLAWEKIVCLHMNDSKNDLGSRKDRHELLGKGKIGIECFETIMTHKKFAEIPICLETPKGDDNINDRNTLIQLKKMRKLG